MIITCPHCQTRYQVTYEAIGSVGRKVQCAHCQEAWQQPPVVEPPAQDEAVFDALAEDAADEAMRAEGRAVAAKLAHRLKTEAARNEHGVPSGAIDPATIRNRQRAFSRRQQAMSAEMPLARLRRAARVIGLAVLGGAFAILYFGRVEVVERFPELAGVYAALGLGVNVVGLDFTNVSTLRTLKDGQDLLIVSAQIVGLTAKPVVVPPVVVTLLDAQGSAIYAWSVNPGVHDLMANERTTLDTQLAAPPADAARVRLSFAGGDSGASSPATATTPPPAETPAEIVVTPAPEHQPAPEHH
jgi:predicted Zn finger-like uncharacterized protein